MAFYEIDTFLAKATSLTQSDWFIGGSRNNVPNTHEKNGKRKNESDAESDSFARSRWQQKHQIDEEVEEDDGQHRRCDDGPG